MTEQSPTTRSTGLRPVLMVVVLGMAYFFSNFHRLSLSVIGDVIAVDYDLTSQQLTTLGSAIFYSYALMQIPCGFIADRVPAKRLIAGSCVLAAGATLWFAYASGFTSLVLARVLTGLATALVYVPSLAVIRKQFGDRRYGTMTGIIVAMGQLGSVCASAPLKFLADQFSWRFAFLIIGAVSVALAVAAWFLVLDPEAHERGGIRKKSSWKAALSAGSLSIAVWFFITGGTRLSFQSLWGTRYFTQSLELDTSAASLYLMLISVGCIVGSVILGRVADKIGNVRTVVFSTIAFAALWACFALLRPAIPAPALAVLCLLLGAMGAGGFTVGFSCIRLFAGKESTGIVTGVSNCCAFMGSAVFTQINGTIMGFAPQSSSSGQFSFLLMLFFLLSLAGAVLVALVNRKRFKQ